MNELMESMNSRTSKVLGDEAEIELKRVAERHGLILKRERGTYTGDSFTTKWTFTCKTESGVPADFIRWAPLFGLGAEDFGRKFSTWNGTYTICGIAPRNRKYPILGKDIHTGKKYKFTEGVVSNKTEKHAG